MTVVQQGQINTTALIVPDMYVQIVPPSVSQLNGLPTNILGFVGTAQWGPANAPVVCGSMADYARNFGAIQARTYDMGTALAAAVLQGANTFRCVRVTDGTDVAASVLMNSGSVASATLGGTLTGYTAGATVAFPAAPAGGVTATGVVNGTGTLTSITITNPGAGYLSGPVPVITAVSGGSGATATSTLAVSTNGLTITAKYTGTLGNSLVATLNTGSAAGTYKIILALPGQVPEVFDNIGVGLSGNALLLAIATAVNNGVNGVRGPSVLATASVGVGTGAPAVGTIGQTQTLINGTDGVTTITGATLIGQDTVPRKGMYALRNTQTSIGVLADVADTTTFSAQVAYGLSEGTYMIGTTPASDSIATAVSTKASAGIDSYAFKYLFGDWVYFNDTVNGQTRLISPQGFVAGCLANLGPHQSSLNKQIYGVVGTQKSSQNLNYSSAELMLLGQAGIDVIANPIPAGNMFGARFGHNSSSNPVVNGDNYTRMTNYIAYTLQAGMGLFVGKLQSTQTNDPTRRQVGATLTNFFAGMQQQGQIDSASVQCDLNNNLVARIALGYLQADVKVKFLSVVEKFIINVEGGQSVQINTKTTQLAS